MENVVVENIDGILDEIEIHGFAPFLRAIAREAHKRYLYLGCVASDANRLARILDGEEKETKP